MHLVRDLLDKQLVDMENYRIGKIDGLVMEFESGSQPRMTALEVGCNVVGQRLTSSLGRSGKAAQKRSLQILWSDVDDIGVSVKVRVDRKTIPLERWQQWLRTAIVGRMPGGRG